MHEQNECTLCWITRDGSPAGSTVSFVLFDDKLWLTALAASARVKALKRNPNSVIVISGKGCEVGHSRCVSLRGTCGVASDAAERDRFFPAFARAVLPNSEKGASMMAKGMNTPENLVLVFTPSKIIPYDSQEMLDRANSM